MEGINRRNTAPKKKKRINWGLVGHDLLRLVIALAAAAIIFAMVCNTVISPEHHTITVNSVAAEDVYAARTVENLAETEKLRTAARDAVGMIYAEDPSLTQDVLSALNTCFEQMQSVRTMGEEEKARQLQNLAVPVVREITFSEDFLAECDASIVGVSLTEQSLISLLNMLQADFEDLRSVTILQVNSALSNGIKEDQLADQLAFIGRNLRSEDSALTEDAQRIAIEMVNALVKANYIADEEATENARVLAADKVLPVMILSGESIVRKGDVITEEDYNKLGALGLLETERNVGTVYFSLALLILLIFAMGGMYLLLFDREILDQFPKFMLLIAVALLVSLLCWLGRKLSYILMPMAAAATLYAMLLNRRSAHIMNILLALIAGLLAGEPGAVLSPNGLAVATACSLAGMLSINMLTTRSQRGTVMLCGVTASFVYLLVFSLSSLLDMSFLDFAKTRLFYTACYSVCSGVGAAVIVLGSFTLWENVFGMMTPMMLLELTNPNQPLLRQLLLEAPGTHHHSVVVSNLAESAADAVGANPMLARCGAMYHDIGKLRRPTFFKENQSGIENPHDSIDPSLSARILVSHVLDGKEMAEKARLPKEVIRIISGHHGDTLAAYFFAKAKNESEHPEFIKEEDYRYPGPLPTTKEEAIVMLADSVEAAVRSLPKHTPESMEEMVRKIVRGKKEDGQLDYCDLTFGELETITKVFLSVLSGIYHERISYPPVKEEKKS